jgi:2-polyprenyl-3-methyl-5-hydroxy-6-metoxy-1,4-benzoquinol methylase
VVASETLAQRRAREQRRTLFDGVAGLYDTSRQGYPAELVDEVAARAGAGPGAAVLEIGCGTGQLTRQLAGRGFGLTAIDIGASMVRTAQRHVTEATVRFQACSFEAFTADGPFDLIASATAFHWVDPRVGLPKAARLLRPGGWLALLTTGERYAEPLQSRLHELWLRYNRSSQEWTSQPAWLTGLRDGDLFGDTVEIHHTRSLRLPAETVLGVERTRATFLSWPESDQTAFTADLEALLDGAAAIDVVQETFLAMAPTAGAPLRS